MDGVVVTGGDLAPMRPRPPETQRFARFSTVPPSDPWPEGELADTRETEKAFSVSAPPVRDRATLTMMTGPDAGQVFALDRDECVVGRDFDVHVRLEDTSVSRRHARLTRRGGAFIVEDMGSTNGTYVGGQKITSRELASGDRIQVGARLTLRFAMTDETEDVLQRQLYESSTRDPLTRAFNRKYLWERMAAEIAHAHRHGTSLAVLMLDIDDFKGTNDTHGHLVGDAVLRAIADEVQTLIRAEDVFARFGGEEFVVLIRATGVDDAPKLAERLRGAIERLRIPAGSRDEDIDVAVTISVGVASLSELPGQSEAKSLLERADQRLYRAKSEGRNRVCSDG